MMPRWLLAWLAGLVMIVPASPALAHPGWGIVRDAQGNIYYTDLQHVWRRAPDGTLSIAVRGVHTHELYLDAAGNLYGEHLWYEGEATDRWGHRVWRRSPDGQVKDIVPPTPGFRKEPSFVRDAAGAMYWADHGQIFRRRPGSATESVSPQRFGDIRSLTVSREGEVFLVANGSLYQINQIGAARRLALQLAESAPTMPFVGEHHQIMGLWLDSGGNAYVAIFGGQKVKRVTAKGGVQVVARSTSPWSPTGGLVAPDGSLWLLEYSLTNQARVRNASRPDEGRPVAIIFALAAGALLVMSGIIVLRGRRDRARLPESP